MLFRALPGMVERLVLDEFFELHLEPRYSLDIEINADLSQWGRRSQNVLVVEHQQSLR